MSGKKVWGDQFTYDVMSRSSDAPRDIRFSYDGLYWRENNNRISVRPVAELDLDLVSVTPL